MTAVPVRQLVNPDADRIDAVVAGKAALSHVTHVARTQTGKDFVGLALSGQLARDQAPQDRDLIAEALGQIAPDGPLAPQFWIAPDPVREIGPLGSGLQVALLEGFDGTPRIVFARHLGFLAMVLAARRSIVDLLVQQFERAGLSASGPTLAQDILHMLGDTTAIRARSVRLTIGGQRRLAIGR
ncbi:MAG: hypothetical protein AAF919_12495 [Pseudomonadota bacterium]